MYSTFQCPKSHLDMWIWTFMMKTRDISKLVSKSQKLSPNLTYFPPFWMSLLFNCSNYIFVPRVAKRNPNTHSQRRIWKWREGRSWEAHCLRLGLWAALGSLVGLRTKSVVFSISVDTVIRSGLTPLVPGRKSSNTSCLVEFQQKLLGWQHPVLWALPQSFLPTFAALPRVWDTFHNIHSFSLVPCGQQASRPF